MSGRAGAKTYARETWVAVVAGILSGATSKAITYPLETAKTWLAKKTSHESYIDVIKELWLAGTIDNGLLMRLGKYILHNLLVFHVMTPIVLLIQAVSSKLQKMRGLPQTREFGMLAFLLAGFFGDILLIPVVAPVEYVVVQVMTSRTFEGPNRVIRRTMRKHGVAGFYVGWPVYFLIAARPVLKEIMVHLLTYLARALNGEVTTTALQNYWFPTFADITSSMSLYPLHVSRIIVTSGSDEVASLENDRRGGSIVNTIKMLMMQEGFFGLYKGFSLEVTESLLGSMIQRNVKGKITKHVRSWICG